MKTIHPHQSNLLRAIMNLSAIAWGLGGGLLAADLGSGGQVTARRTVSLDGTWQTAEGTLDAVPKSFDHQVAVPGLVDMAQPAFEEVGVKSSKREAFWYRRTFRLDEAIPAVAVLKVHKAMFGTRVILNGVQLGEH